MNILLVNDDGYTSKIYCQLRDYLIKNGHHVCAFAPYINYSTNSAKINLGKKIETVCIDKAFYAVKGTPIDCLHIGMKYMSNKHIKPDLVMSGINQGLNYGSTVLYSATTMVAIESNLFQVNSIALSMEHSSEDEIWIMDKLMWVVENLLHYYLNQPRYLGFTLNVNFLSCFPTRVLKENDQINFDFILPNIHQSSDVYWVECSSNSLVYQDSVIVGGINRKTGYYLNETQLIDFALIVKVVDDSIKV